MLDIIEEELLQNGTTKANLGSTFFKTGSTVQRALDHLYTNKYDKLSNIEIIQSAPSDHLPVSFLRNTKNIIIKNKYLTIRNYSKMKIEEFNKDIANDKDIKIAANVDDSIVATELLQKILQRHLDNHAPFKTIQLKHRFLPYLNEVTKDVIKQRDSKHKESLKEKTNQILWGEYKTL